MLPVVPKGIGGALVRLPDDRGQSRQHLGHDRLRNGLELAGVASAQIQCAGLVAPDNASGTGTGTLQRDSEACRAREAAAARNRKYDWGFSQLIEPCRRDNQYGPRPLLLMARGWIQ